MYMIPGGNTDEYTIALVGKLKDIIREEVKKEEEELKEAAKNLPAHSNTYVPWNEEPNAVKYGTLFNIKYCSCCKIAYKRPPFCQKNEKKEKKSCCASLCSLRSLCSSCSCCDNLIPMGCDCCPIPGLDCCHISMNIPELCVGLCGLCCIEEYEDEYSNRGN